MVVLSDFLITYWAPPLIRRSARRTLLIKQCSEKPSPWAFGQICPIRRTTKVQVYKNWTSQCAPGDVDVTESGGKITSTIGYTLSP